MYATAQELLDRYGDDTVFATGDQDGDNALDATIARALADASAEVDLYLGQRYSLPLVTVPEPVVRLTCTLAWYYVTPEHMVTEERRKRYEDAVALLRRLASGEVGLGLPAADDGTASGLASFDAQPRLFSRSTMGGLA